MRVIFPAACMVGFMLMLLCDRFTLAFPAAWTIGVGAFAMVFAQRGTVFRQQVERHSREAQDFIAFGGWFLIAMLAAGVVVLWMIVPFYPQYIARQ